MTHLITDFAVNWINNQNSGMPFFLYLPFTAPHKPYQGPDDYNDRPLTVEQENAPNPEGFMAMMEELDKGVGKILAKVEEEGMTENTLVIFVSDNGPAAGSSGPFRDNKGSLYEGGIRVPCIIRWPGYIAPGTVSDQMGITMDLTASIARIAGASAPEGRPFDGVDIIQDIEQGEATYPRTLFWRKQRADIVIKAVRDGNMKYLRIQNGSTVTDHVYNLQNDPQEKNDLMNQHRYSDQSMNLKALLNDWEEQVKPER